MRLRAAGHEVVVATGDRWQAALASEGLAGRVLPLLGADPRDGDFGFRLWGRGAQMAVPLAAELRGWQPDAVVSDTLTVCGGFAAGLLGVPWAELLPHPLQDLPVTGPPQGLGLQPGRGPLGRARDAALRALTQRSLDAAARQRAAALAGIGLPPALAPAVRLIATLPALERQSRPDAVVVGPLEWDAATTELPQPPGEAPLVLLSPTTASGAAPDALLGAALAGLGGVRPGGLRLACTRAEPATGLPPWAVVGPGRQAPLLDAAAVVVCGGGGGILGKALRRGLPLVVLPGGGDQRENADRVRRLGAGVVLDPRRVTPAALSAAVGEVLTHPAYAWSARAAARGAGADPVAVLETAFSQR